MFAQRLVPNEPLRFELLSILRCPQMKGIVGLQDAKRTVRLAEEALANQLPILEKASRLKQTIERRRGLMSAWGGYLVGTA